jgi:hypothetical protein
MKIKAAIFIMCVILFSCRKGSNPQVTLTGALTDCPANTTCTYSYYDNADIQIWNHPVSGTHRVFEYQSFNANLCDATTGFYFKTSIFDTDFDITSNQIAEGQAVGYIFSCACCDIVANFHPIGGEIKGKKTDATHWLVNATIVMGTSATTPLDTLVVNQYFTQQQLP